MLAREALEEGDSSRPPPPILPVRNKRYASGHIELPDGRDLYINRGLGYLIRARLNVRPEATLFRLETA
jgi:hypothetical protein